MSDGPSRWAIRDTNKLLIAPYWPKLLEAVASIAASGHVRWPPHGVGTMLSRLPPIRVLTSAKTQGSTPTTYWPDNDQSHRDLPPPALGNWPSMPLAGVSVRGE